MVDGKVKVSLSSKYWPKGGKKKDILNSGLNNINWMRAMGLREW